MRLFTAVYPDERFTAALSARLDPWRDRLDVRWTPREQWHVTLEFLGEWPEERVAGLQEALEPVAARADFGIRPGGLGAFPNLGRPRVLFVQQDGGEQLARLADAVRAASRRAWPEGPQDGKAFRPHLTVGRVRDGLPDDHVKLLSGLVLEGLPSYSAGGLSLVASSLGPGGATHRELAFWRLRKKGE